MGVSKVLMQLSRKKFKIILNAKKLIIKNKIFEKSFYFFLNYKKQVVKLSIHSHSPAHMRINFKNIITKSGFDFILCENSVSEVEQKK